MSLRPQCLFEVNDLFSLSVSGSQIWGKIHKTTGRMENCTGVWGCFNKLTKMWKSNLPRRLKERLFLATVEFVLLYGFEAWTLTPKLEKQTNGCYTRLVRKALNIHWSQHMNNKVLYGDLSKLSAKNRQRRMCFAGHCYRSKDERVSVIVLWTPIGIGGGNLVDRLELTRYS